MTGVDPDVATKAATAIADAARTKIECVIGTNLCKKADENVVEKYIVYRPDRAPPAVEMSATVCSLLLLSLRHRHRLGDFQRRPARLGGIGRRRGDGESSATDLRRIGVAALFR